MIHRRFRSQWSFSINRRHRRPIRARSHFFPQVAARRSNLFFLLPRLVLLPTLLMSRCLAARSLSRGDQLAKPSTPLASTRSAGFPPDPETSLKSIPFRDLPPPGRSRFVRSLSWYTAQAFNLRTLTLER